MNLTHRIMLSDKSYILGSVTSISGSDFSNGVRRFKSMTI